jgi:type IV secretion system protein VirD4
VRDTAPSTGSEVHGLAPGERIWIGALAVLLALLWVGFAGAWLAARLVGERLRVRGQEAVEAIWRLPSHWSDPARAWPAPAATRLPGPWLYWASTAAVAAPLLVAGWWILRRRRRRVGLERRVRLGVDTEARIAGVADLAPLLVDGPVPGRLILGTIHGRIVATEAPIPRPTAVVSRSREPSYRPVRGSVMLVGPSQSGKSTCAICGILEWDGPAVLSSVKTDLADETFGWRSTRGECRVFDPVGITGLPAASWSPLRGAATVEGAQAAARALVDCAPRSAMHDDAFWYQQAEIVLAGYLWVASTNRLGMRDVVRWVFTQDAPSELGPGEVQPLMMIGLEGSDPFIADQAATVSETLEGVWRLEDRMRSSIFGTAQAAIWPWSNPKVVGSSQGCDLTLEWLLSGNNTVYACAPLRAARRLAPALGGLIGDLLEQVAERVAASGRPLDPPLLIVLDEVGNTPLRELPELVSTLAGLGVQIVTVWQSVAQVKAAYREQAGTIVANHRSKAFFSGISDPDTFELAVRLVGDEQVVSRQLSADLGAGDSARRSVQESTVTTPAVPGHVLRQQPSGTALLIHGTVPPAHLRVRSHFEDPVLFDRANRPLPVVRAHTSTPPASGPPPTSTVITAGDRSTRTTRTT